MSLRERRCGNKLDRSALWGIYRTSDQHNDQSVRASAKSTWMAHARFLNNQRNDSDVHTASALRIASAFHPKSDVARTRHLSRKRPACFVAHLHKSGLSAYDAVADLTELGNPVRNGGVSVRLFRKITEFVDKDVASNGKPISIIGLVIPFLPFMIFVDGPPADSFPMLAGLALSVSVCWLLFVIWRVFRHIRDELALASFKLWLLIVATIVFILLWAGCEIWLSNKLGWPEAYGFSCHGRGCFFEDLSHSPRLLRGGSVYEVELFAMIWLLPAFLVGTLVYAFIKWLFRPQSYIRPMD